MRYELFYLIGTSQEEELPKIKERVKEIITASGGVFEAKETLEKRRLSYNIGRETHGIYTAQRFELEKSDNLKEIASKFNSDPGILRFILSRAEDLPELKSKEERISETTQKETASRLRKEEKSARDALSASKQEFTSDGKNDKEPKEEKPNKKVGSEDIDKKLEEILNI